MRLRYFVALAAMFTAGMVCRASDITYDINQTVGSAHAVGTVTTDGTIGILTGADIVGFTLTVSNGASMDTISNTTGDESIVIGSDLTATSSGLFFNFGDTGATGFALTDAGQQNGICFVTATGMCTMTGISIEIGVNGTDFTNPPIDGVEQIASVPVSATPEPSSIALLGTAFLSSVGLIRRRLA